MFIKLFTVVFLLFSSQTPIWAASARSYDASRPDWKRQLDMLSIRLGNFETDLRTLEERIENQGETTDSLQQTLSGQEEKRKTALRDQISQVKKNGARLTADLQSMKERLEKVAQQLIFQEKKIARIETNFQHMQEALQSIMGALDIQSPPSGFYTVANGDSLEKIAKKYHTSIKEIKEVNQLNTDKIIVGQKLQLPPPKNGQ